MGTVLNSVGMMGELVVLGWLALTLTDSPFMVGLAMGARALPLFFVGMPAGVLADLIPRRRLLIAAGVGQALTAASMGLLIMLGWVGLLELVLLTIVAGTLRAVEHAARQSYTHDIVGAASLVNGLALLGVAMRMGWLLGSLGAGVIVARWGSGPAYVGVAGCYLAGAAALLSASNSPRVTPAIDGSLWRGMADFLALVHRDRTLVILMVLTAGAEVLGFAHQAVLPSLARDVLHTGPEGLGALNAARSVGGVLGLLASMRGSVRGGGTLFLIILVSFGASVASLGLAPYVVGFAGVLVVLTVTNAVGALADLLAQSLLQFGVSAELRGRAGGAWVVAIGLAPIGQLQIGGVASLFGVSAALGASGLGLVALTAAVAWLYPRFRRM